MKGREGKGKEGKELFRGVKTFLPHLIYVLVLFSKVPQSAFLFKNVSEIVSKTLPYVKRLIQLVL